MKMSLNTNATYESTYDKPNEWRSINGNGTWPSPLTERLVPHCDKWAHPTWQPMAHKTMYHSSECKSSARTNVPAARAGPAFPTGRVVACNVRTGRVPDTVVHNMCAAKKYFPIQAECRVNTLPSDVETFRHAQHHGLQMRHGYPSIDGKHTDASFFPNIKSIDGCITMEDFAAIDYHRAMKAVNEKNKYGQPKSIEKGYSWRFLNSLPDNPNLMPPKPRWNKQPSDLSRPYTKEVVQTIRAILWILFDNAEDARMEIAYSGCDPTSKTIYHPSDKVHINGQSGVESCSWRNFKDAGFPPDSRQSDRHEHTLGSARTNVPANSRAVRVDEPRPTRGCYDDICDYYGLPDDHPLRYFHP